MTTIKKNFEIDLIRMSRDIDLLLKIRHRKGKSTVCLNSNKM